MANEEVDGEQMCKVDIAYIGYHFSDPKDIRFCTLDAYYSHLPQWAGVFPFLGYQKPFDEVKATTTKGMIIVQPTPPLKEKLEYAFIDEEVLSEMVRMRLETQEPLSLEQWMTQFITPFQDLLTLATQRLNTLVSIQAYVQQNNETKSGISNLIFPVQIIFSEKRQPLVSPSQCFPETILFSLHDVADNFSHAMESWLQTAEVLDSVYSLFFGTRYSSLYLNQRFLFTAQAAESYQSGRAERLVHSEEEHQRIVELLMTACPEEYKEWLTDTLDHSNFSNFRYKLKNLVRSTQYILAPLIGANAKSRETQGGRVP